MFCKWSGIERKGFGWNQGKESALVIYPALLHRFHTPPDKPLTSGIRSAMVFQC